MARHLLSQTATWWHLIVLIPYSCVHRDIVLDGAGVFVAESFRHLLRRPRRLLHPALSSRCNLDLLPYRRNYYVLRRPAAHDLK